ncbi:MAG: diguanylate cyclase [Fimbriimonadaceae bacterium]|nr:diguanylate cyclase [Fimbriimonadaceae bacterium]
MSESSQFQKLIELLHHFGVHTVQDRKGEFDTGFPVYLPLQDGGSLLLDLPEPGLISSLDPDSVGVAVIDLLGYPRAVWGLARRVRFFKGTDNVLYTDIGALVKAAMDGVSGSLYLDGMRFHVGGIDPRSATDLVVLVTNANEERSARRQASKSSREAEALKRLGRVLSMNQQLTPLAIAAVHEITSATELAAVLLWVANHETQTLSLTASTGANRSGTSALQSLDLRGGGTCIAELVAMSKQGFSIPNVADHLLTADLEAKFCYLKPGPMSVHPLEIGDTLIGVLELIGREGEANFPENLELFEVMAEHLALALNNSLLFEKLEKQASHDPLTGIANHRTLHEFLKGRIAETQRTGQELSAVMIDVDHFRSFNEEEGHEAGDTVLKMVADTLKAALRPYDLCARYGGEEFTLVLPGSNAEAALIVAERVRKRIESVPFITRTGRMRHVTASMGLAVYPESAQDGVNLLRAADQALFEAKRTGRNRIVVFEGELGEVQTDDFDVSSLWKFVTAKSRKKVEEKLDKLEVHMHLLEVSLGLTKSQRQMLRGLAMLQDVYRRAKKSTRTGMLEKLETAPELRALLPSLQALEERYDGRGPLGQAGNRVPLLSRVLSVCNALVEDSGKSLLEPPGKYDPEIVAIVARMEDAA